MYQRLSPHKLFFRLGWTNLVSLFVAVVLGAWTVHEEMEKNFVIFDRKGSTFRISYLNHIWTFGTQGQAEILNTTSKITVLYEICYFHQASYTCLWSCNPTR